MQKIVLVIITSLVVGSISLMMGYNFGINYRTKIDATIYLPLLVRVHQSIQRGNMSDARDRTDMMIVAQVNKYWKIKDTFLFRVGYGNKLNDNDLFQKHLKEALAIAQSSVTNLVTVTVGSPTTNSIDSELPSNVRQK